jgi:hypothetical protein
MNRRDREVDALEESASVVFTCDELWLLQRCIRHEVPQQETWKFPPASIEFNDQIAAALLLCATYGLGEAALRLSWGDLLAIDYTVPPDAKDVNGRPIGRNLLLKSYAARAQLRRAYPMVEVPESANLDKAELQRRLVSGWWEDHA